MIVILHIQEYHVRFCSSFFSSKKLLYQYIASAYNSSISCYSFVTEHCGRCSCNYVLFYMVEQQNYLLHISVDVLAMVADVMSTQLLMILGNVGGMVVDVMTTQDVCTMWHILKLIVVDIITTHQHVFYMSCWHIKLNLILCMLYICGF